MYCCLKADFENLEKKINSVRRTIGRYGYELKFEIVKETVEKVPVYSIDPTTQTKYQSDIVWVEVVYYNFEMDDFKVGNYEPVAYIEHDVVFNVEGCTNMVNTFKEDFQIPQEWRTIGGHCDDCNDKYLRQKTVMLQDMNTGAFRQIGMTCLKKYLGITAFNVINNYRNIRELLSEDPSSLYVEYSRVGSYVKTYYETERAIACVYDSMSETKGFIKDKTYDGTLERLRDRDYTPSKEATDKAKEVVKFFNDFDVESCSSNNFVYNLIIQCRQEVTSKLGMIIYVDKVYNKLVKQVETKNDQMLGEYVGNVAEKVTVDVEVERCSGFENNYGNYSYVIVFKDLNSHNRFVWITSSKCYDEGIKLRICGTIKGHKEYNGAKQTQLTRVKELAIL